MIIRKCELSDAESICSLIINELGYYNISKEGIYERFERLLAAKEYTFLAAELDGEVCGFVSFVSELSLEVDGEYIRVLCLAVKSGLQGNGIGSELIKAVEYFAAERNAALITLSSNFKRPRAHEFYEKNGFIKTSFTFKKFMR